MTGDRKNPYQHELIGLKAEIVESSNPALCGKKGVIMDETRNTLKIEENGDIKVIPKKEVSLSVQLTEEKEVKMKGKKLVARPEDRVKKFRG